MDEVIYVQGKDYGKDKAMAWRFAHPRITRTTTRLTLFDCPSGNRTTWVDWTGALPPHGQGSETKPIRSILDLYEYIKGAKTGSVIELQFFSHGFYDGPILFDTWDLRGDPNTRDPDDLDPRIKDFRDRAVLGGSELAKFRVAFASNALIKLWGCTHDEGLRQLIKKDFFAANDEQKKAAILQNYRSLIKNGTYQFALHTAINRPVFAAPFGWGTSPHLPFGIQGKAAEASARYRGKFPPEKGDIWWRVSPYFRPDRGFEFYQKQLGATFDVLDYVAYTKALVEER